MNTRPTADRVREAIFNILQENIAGATVLDLFSGSGALALEALSRGADTALAIDSDPAAIAAIKHNIVHCDVMERMRAAQWDIQAGLGILRRYPETYSLVFMDPPYDSRLAGIAMAHLCAAQCTAANATIVIEHDQKTLPDAIDGFCALADRRRYGKTLVSFFATMI
jgi:16S rRNA (guanine966-N2)-methyltransferase